MRGLLKHLWPGGGTRRGVICHLRENGPIAYEFDLFGTDARPRADAMLDSGISWTWKGADRVSLSAFLADLTSGRVLVLGTEGDTPHDLDDAAVSQWIRHFSRIQPSPIVAVISVSGGRHLLFVQQHSTDAVNQLLESMGVDKGRAERRSYARLGDATVEALAERLR